MAELLSFGSIGSTTTASGPKADVVAIFGSNLLKEKFPDIPIEVIAQVAYPSMSWVTLVYLHSFTNAVVDTAIKYAARMNYATEDIMADAQLDADSKQEAISKLTKQEISHYAF